MAEVRLTVKDIDDSNRRAKFTAAVQSLSKAMRIPLTIRPKETRKQEAFGFQAEEDLVNHWNTYMGHTLDAVYRTVCSALGLPLIETFTKALGDENGASPLLYKGKVVFNPETGKPIRWAEFEKIIAAIERFLNRRLDPAKRRIVLDAVSLGRVMARKLLTLPSEEVRKLPFGAVEYQGKTVPWMADDLDRQDKLFGPTRPEERARMKAHYERIATAVDIAEESMGDHITRMEEEAVHAVRRSIIDGIKGRQSRAEVAQNLFNKFGNLNRDWQRISETETVDTFNNAMLRETVAVAEPGEKVYFRRVEMRDEYVCDYCEDIRGIVALWVDQPMTSEDIEDPVAKVAIWEGKSNVGHKKADYWVPAGTVHPWCRGSWERYFPPIAGAKR